MVPWISRSQVLWFYNSRESRPYDQYGILCTMYHIYRMYWTRSTLFSIMILSRVIQCYYDPLGELQYVSGSLVETFQDSISRYKTIFDILSSNWWTVDVCLSSLRIISKIYHQLPVKMIAPFASHGQSTLIIIWYILLLNKYFLASLMVLIYESILKPFQKLILLWWTIC